MKQKMQENLVYHNENKRKFYNQVKELPTGEKYMGMMIGGKHHWNYKDGNWKEMKVAPDQWTFSFSCNKYRIPDAPEGTGALNNTQFRWFIVADQQVTKVNANCYETEMKGIKFKVAHKRPYWKNWSYEYQNVEYEDIIIKFLEQIIENLRKRK